MNVLVGVTGSIGALGIHMYLLRLMAQPGVVVRAVMTPAAARFVRPETLGAVLHAPVPVGFWSGHGRWVSPPEIIEGVDLLLVAPASATTLAYCAHGNAATIVSACYLCHAGPTIFAPSMSPGMLGHPAVVRNIRQLRNDGALVLPSGRGVAVSSGAASDGALCEFDEMWVRTRRFWEHWKRTHSGGRRSSECRASA